MKKKKPLRVPVTRGLKDIYAMDMHSAYQAACMGQFSVIAFSRLAAAISVVRSALEQKQTRIEGAIATLDETIVILMSVRSRGDETDVWELTESERPAVLAGIDMAEECIGTLDVALLERTAQQLLAAIAAEPPGA
ncbi:MAG: hypothetical protein A2Z95_04895 [Gallionellales bacterium GWA2_60_18]|nr:MAG: hypothetical protein A2Z95_04895 [Gallionellales bacterium GWA2_60_18]